VFWKYVIRPWNAATPENEIRSPIRPIFSLKLERGYGTFQFSLSGDHHLAAQIEELVTDMIVYYKLQKSDSWAFFQRYRCVGAIDDIDEDTHRVHFSFIDYKGVLDRRELRPDAGLLVWGTDVAPASIPNIFWYLLSIEQGKTNGNMNITQGIGFPGSAVIEGAQFNDGDSLYYCMEQLRDLWYFHWDIDGELHANFWTGSGEPGSDVGRGNDNGVSLVLGDNRPPVGIRSLRRTRNMNDFSHDNFFTANADLVPIHYEPTFANTAPEGRWYQTYPHPDVEIQWQFDQIAVDSYDWSAHPDAEYQLVLVGGFWKGLDHIGLGDTLGLQVNRGRLDVDEEVNVLEIMVEPDENGEENVRMSVGVKS
jgi:hypothetical protein